jgi:2-keto-4-pentenoate hydratase/2-oxohepta-3-ene-1,7-dioic acid hydratase in catechol pathway
MLLVTYKHKGKIGTGVKINSWLVDLQRSQQEYLGREQIPHQAALEDVISLLGIGNTALETSFEAVRFISEQLPNELEVYKAKGILVPFVDVNLIPPVRKPGKIVCVGMNYPDPFSERNSKSMQYPVLFLKPSSTLVGHKHPIRIPAIAKEVLYEGELAVVIGRSAKNISQKDALNYVAGYTVANDVGAHDLEKRTSQWTTGKILDTFCPLGPFLVTPDEVPNPNDLWIKTTLNSDVVQESNTREMVFDVSYLLSYISSLTTLDPGDVILTGSPKRCGDKPDPRKRMKPGDMITVSIEKLGDLTNPVIEEV